MLCPMRPLTQSACVAIAIAFVVVGAADATTYYVRQVGDDDNTGLFPSRAWRTLTKAGRIAKAGDTVIVGAGEFIGQLAVKNSGTQASPVVFLADVGGTFTKDVGACVLAANKGSVVVLDQQSHVQFRGIRFRGSSGLVVNGSRSSGIWFHDCEFLGAASDVVRLHGGTTRFSNCTFRDNGGLAIKTKSGAVLAVDRCRFTKNAGGAIGLQSDDCSLRLHASRVIENGGVALQLGGPALVANCLLARNSTGIVIEADKVNIAFCTIADQQRDGLVVRGDEVVVANTIIASNRGAGVSRRSGELLLAHNLVFSNRAGNYDGIDRGPTDLRAPPLFEDEIDYRLSEKSPAINGGTYLDLHDDLFSNHRPLGGGFDIGCHEFVSPKRATTYYVRRKGDDTNDGARPKTAWATLGHAATVAMRGDTIYVGGGVYEETALFSRAGTAEQPITFVADNKGKHTGDKGQVTIIAPDGESYSCRFVEAAHTRLIGFRFTRKEDQQRQGVYLFNSDEVSFEDCSFDRLTSAISATFSNVNLQRVEVWHCKPRSVTVGTGRLTAVESEFTRNHTGLHARADAALLATGCKFSKNAHSGACVQGKAEVTESEFNGNAVIGLWTKGIDESLLAIADVEASGNRGYGWLLDECHTRLNDQHWPRLKLDRNAIAVGVLGGSAVIDGAALRQSAKYALVARGADLTVRNSQLSSEGGGLHLERNRSCTIETTWCQGAGQGSGLSWSGGDATIKNCVMARFNTGVRAVDDDLLGSLEIWNCTFAEIADTGIDHRGGDFTLRNSIFVAREQGRTGLASSGIGLLNHSHNILFGFDMPFHGTEQNEGEVTANPRFVSTAKQDYRLRPGSPAINAGCDASGIIEVDIAGNPRPSHRAWEIGAHEYLEQGGSFRILKWQERR